ncbi:hypothetical protein Hanom_Chr13g01219341 [Helianthus anomalus]
MRHVPVRLLPRHLPPGPCSPCEVQNAPSKRPIAPIAHATRSRVRVRVNRTLRKYSSVCFHETIRMVCSHLKNPFNFHLSPMVSQCR